jgi:protein-L-isoaspartate(D-aspartate) O-methyltransferase
MKKKKTKHKIKKVKHKMKYKKRILHKHKRTKHIKIQKPVVKQESSRKFLHELKQSKKLGKLSDKKEFEFMLKSIEMNNPTISQDILDAFRLIDRKNFTKHLPYEDEAIHIAHGQTISQPTTIARMLNMLKLEQGQKVLEIGTNTGYHAALVSLLVYPGKVTSLELFQDLAKQAENNIKKLNLELKKSKKVKKELKIKILTGDALNKEHEVWKEEYDRIYYTAGVEESQREAVKISAVQSLKEDGLLLFPTREHFDYGGLELWQKKQDNLILIVKDQGYSFVPLIKQEDIEEVYKKLK